MKQVSEPLVSICVITYNHEEFIRECLDSLIAQTAAFNYEIVIGEDASTDQTRVIIESEYANKFTNIRLLKVEENLGAIPNFVRTLNSCSGKYIAFCEGDDYWIDPLKLQKQVDFLEANPNYGGVCTNNRWFDQCSNTFKDSIQPENEISFENLLSANTINSQSILFRKTLLGDINWIKELKIGDWALHLMVSNKLPYYRLKTITTVYRVHGGGIHSLSSNESKLVNSIQVLKSAAKHLDLTIQQKELVKNSILNYYKRLIGLNTNSIAEYRKQYYKFGGGVFNKTLLLSYL